MKLFKKWLALHANHFFYNIKTFKHLSSHVEIFIQIHSSYMKQIRIEICSSYMKLNYKIFPYFTSKNPPPPKTGIKL